MELPGASFLNYEHITSPFLPPCMCYHTQSQSSRQILDCQSTLLLVQILRHTHSSFPGFLLYHLGHEINLLPLYSSACITDMLQVGCHLDHIRNVEGFVSPSFHNEPLFFTNNYYESFHHLILIPAILSGR